MTGGVVDKWDTAAGGNAAGAVQTRIDSSDNSVVGPAIDHSHTSVYYFTTSASAGKLALKRYNWRTGEVGTVRETDFASFPGPTGGSDDLFQLAVEEEDAVGKEHGAL